MPALPGAPAVYGELPDRVLQTAGAVAVREAALFKKAGFDGIIIENFGDAPFYAEKVTPVTIAAFSVIASAVKETVRNLSVGINVLRNDAEAALSIAAVTGCDFVRINVLSGVAATDQGLIQGKAAEWVRLRSQLGAPIQILADVFVKHAKTLHSDSLSDAIDDLSKRSGADGLIVTGAGTGKPVNTTNLDEMSARCRKNQMPWYVGSGSSVDQLREIAIRGGGVIVGSSVRKGGVAGEKLEPAKVTAFVKAWKKAIKK